MSDEVPIRITFGCSCGEELELLPGEPDETGQPTYRVRHGANREAVSPVFVVPAQGGAQSSNWREELHQYLTRPEAS